MNQTIKTAIFALTGFLAAWQASDFSLDLNAVLGALTAALVGALSPKQDKQAIDS